VAVKRAWRLLLALMLVGLFLAACRPVEEVEKGPYKVGYSADVTGPAADTFAPILEGFRLYVQHVNDAGGIDGHPIQLITGDNRSSSSKAAADAKKFVEMEKVHMMINSASSVTFAPMIEEAKKGNVPFVIALSGCPQESLPGPKLERTVFCFLVSHLTFNEFMVSFIKKTAGEGAKIAGVAFDVPISRLGIDHGAEFAKKLGLEVVDREVIPLARPDFAAHASRIIARKAEWVYSFGTWGLTVAGPLQALRKLGWKGSYIAPSSTPSETELERLKDEGLFIASPMAFFVEDLPVHREIREVAQKYGAPFPLPQIAWGWIMGIIAEKAFRQCGWPCPTDKLVEVMQNLTVDTQGLTGQPIKWTPNDHFGPVSYRVYRWDSGQGRIIRVADWSRVE